MIAHRVSLPPREQLQDLKLHAAAQAQALGPCYECLQP